MNIFETVQDFRAFMDERSVGQTLGFVPTMGALHQGHLDLVKKSMQDNDLTVCSIFVNPTQFDNPLDLEKYPRTLEADISKLEQVGCNLLFLPSVKEMYPVYPPILFAPDLGMMLQVMEGRHRPGHFAGVMTVVKRLFEIILPNKAYFGEKDFQQLRVIQRMLEHLSLDIEVIPFPTVREKSGLAMSSRNVRLTEEEKDLALHIPRALLHLQKRVSESPDQMSTILQQTTEELNSISGLKLEYLDIVDENTLQNVEVRPADVPIRACLAAYIGKIRLIDNMRL